MKFANYDHTGRIIATGECPDGMEALQAHPGTFIWIGEAEDHDRIDVVTKTLVKGEKPKPGYRALRKYPPIADQLDALWRAMDQGEIPMATDFYAMVKAAKDAVPRPDAVKKVVL